MFYPKFAIVVLLAFHFLFLSTAGADAPMEVSPSVGMNDPRPATDLPLKRKVPTAQPVEVHRQNSDRLIHDRLTRIARSQPPFQKIEVSVSEGIVTLRGAVEEEAYAKSFSSLSEKVEDVIGVIDQMKVTSLKKTGLRLAESEVQGLLRKFFLFLPYLVSCAVLLLATLLLGFATFRFWRYLLLRKLSSRPMLAQHLAKAFSIPVYLLGFYLILQVGGAAGLAATLVGGTGILGIVLGLAGKNILENLLSSFMLTLRNPFKVGDEVVIGEIAGVVHRVDARCTMLLDKDGVFTQIPNSNVLAAVIRNITAHPCNKVSFTLKMSAEEDLARLTELYHQALEMNRALILPEPKPQILLTEMTATEVTVRGEFWMSVHEQDADRVRSSVLQALLYLRRSHQLRRSQTESPNPSITVERSTVEKNAVEKNAVQKLIQQSKNSPSGREVLNQQTKNIREPNL